MAKKMTVAGIDVGTTKICSCIAEVSDSKIEIVGVGWSPSRGLKKGVVVNLSETIRSVKESLAAAEEEAGNVVESAYISAGGRFLRSANTAAQTDVRGKHGRVAPEDVSRAVLAAQEFELPSDYQVIHVLTQGFSLDEQDDIADPLGMSGSRLSVKLHLVFNATAVVENIVNAINKADVVVKGVVMQQLASAEAVLTDDEKELGTVVVDVGGGTTDISVYSNRAIWHSEVLPMGGSLITKDIAIGLRSPLQDAERLKIELGTVYPNSVPEEEMIEISEMGTGTARSYSRRLLCQIVEARCDEILEATQKTLKRAGVQMDLISGVVLTGGGSLMHGFVNRAQEVFRTPVRLGLPLEFESRNSVVFHPAYATALGLLRYAQNARSSKIAKITRSIGPSRPKAATERLKNWFFERI